jgi:hypothetical protein
VLATTLPPAYGKPTPYGLCGYTPPQLRSAYGVPAGLTGAGVTVAVVHPWEQPTAAHDLATFGARHGEPLKPGQFTQILPPGLNASCPDGIRAGNDQITNEETDDVEAVHAMAIYARYGSPAYHDVTDDPLGPDTWLGAALPAGLARNTQPELETFGMDLGLTATVGYDDVTGRRSPGPIRTGSSLACGGRDRRHRPKWRLCRSRWALCGEVASPSPSPSR